MPKTISERIMQQWEEGVRKDVEEDYAKKHRRKYEPPKSSAEAPKTESLARKKAPRLKYQNSKRTLKNLPERSIPSGEIETVSTAPEKAPRLKYQSTKRTLKNLPERSVGGEKEEAAKPAPRKRHSARNGYRRAVSWTKHHLGKKRAQKRA